MRFNWSNICATSVLVICASAETSISSTSTAKSTGTSKSTSIPKTTNIASSTGTRSATSTRNATATTSKASTQTSIAPCAAISQYLSSFAAENPKETAFPAVPALDAMACLESVPLAVDADLAFVQYVEPFIQFQSTQAYLKNPPSGYTVDGVDIFGGLAEITQRLKTGAYKNQYAFEKDIYILVNVMPKDFHFNLPLPLIKLFSFETDVVLVSLSVDGEILPLIYNFADLVQQYRPDSPLNWKASSIVTINGQPAADYLYRIGLQSQPYSDPDAIYNQVFFSLALNVANQGSAFTKGGNLFGFDSATTTFVYANGSTDVADNLAVPQFDFASADIKSGDDILKLELHTATPTAAATSAAPTSTAAPPPVSTTTSLFGYPTPVVIHRDGYTSGYFLPNSSTAVLSLTAFTNAAETEDANPIMQAVVKAFLQACRVNHMTKLIIDLQANGGGSVFNGIDVFKQLFPTIEPFAATRFRETPYVAYFAEQFSDIGIYNENFQSVYQTQANVDMNEKDFSSVKQFVGPYTIYGDNFTALARYNFSDAVAQEGNDIIVSGYLNMTDVAPQEFSPDNIVMIHDGACGSTCAVFYELMKSQGGVRSIAVGGRPQNGPMQAVAGSKGAQVFTFGTVIGYVQELFQFYTSANKPFPYPNVPAAFNVSFEDSPLGSPSGILEGGRFNLRNNYNSSNPSEFPLQFVYEAANCRIFYEPSDLFDITGLWQRVGDMVWGHRQCVAGSSPSSDGTFPAGAYNTVPFSPGVLSNISLPATLPGFVKNNGTGPKSGNSTGTSTATGTATSKPTAIQASSAVGLSSSVGLAMAVMGMVLMVL